MVTLERRVPSIWPSKSCVKGNFFIVRLNHDNSKTLFVVLSFNFNLTKTKTMKTKSISHLAALLIVPAVLSASAFAGPGPHTPPALSKPSEEKAVAEPKRPTTTPTTTTIAFTGSAKGSVSTDPRPRLLTAGQSLVNVSF